MERKITRLNEATTKRQNDKTNQLATERDTMFSNLYFGVRFKLLREAGCVLHLFRAVARSTTMGVAWSPPLCTQPRSFLQSRGHTSRVSAFGVQGHYTIFRLFFQSFQRFAQKSSHFFCNFYFIHSFGTALYQKKKTLTLIPSNLSRQWECRLRQPTNSPTNQPNQLTN